MPNTFPCMQSNQVTFLKSKALDSLVEIYPLGAVSQDLKERN